MLFKVIVCLVIGYIFGCFQTGYFYGKLHGIDIRDYGSHNSGTTNTLRVLGKKAGYIVFLGDGLKAFFAISLIRYIIFPGLGNLTLAMGVITAVGVVLGHNYPFYMDFKGGKGIAAIAGTTLGIDIRFAVIAALCFAIVFFVTRYVSVASLCVSTLLPVLFIIFYFGQWNLAALSLILTAMAWWRHRENIKRLMNGTESRFDKKKKS